jgi:hypothetical protein
MHVDCGAWAPDGARSVVVSRQQLDQREQGRGRPGRESVPANEGVDGGDRAIARTPVTAAWRLVSHDAARDWTRAMYPA